MGSLSITQKTVPNLFFSPHTYLPRTNVGQDSRNTVLLPYNCLQVDLLRQGLLGSYREYGERYCVQQQQQQHYNQQQAGGGYPGSEFRYAVQGRLPELHALLAECVMVRRLKRDVLPDLPDKIR